MSARDEADSDRERSQTCPTCGHTVDEGQGWRPTGQLRIVPSDDEFEVMQVSEASPLMLKATKTWRTQRMWVRTWGESRWRDEP